MLNRRLFLASLTAGALSAHDLYLMPEEFRAGKPGPRRIWFHLGDGFPESDSAIGLDRLSNARAVGQAGEFEVTDIQPSGDRVSGMVDLPAKGTYLITAESPTKDIDLPAAAFENYLEHEGLQHVIEWRKKNGESQKNGLELYTKFVKSRVAVGKPDSFYNHKLGLPIEIIPEADPFTLSKKDKLPIQVLFEGKPAPDLQIQTSWAKGKQTDTTISGRTNQEGRLEVPLGQSGTYRIHTVLMRRAKDWESFWASLTFPVK